MNRDGRDARLRVAILGGGIGAEHLSAYLELPRLYRVEVVCDLDAGRAGRLAGRCGARVETDPARVLADPDIDVIDVCLPPSMHVGVCLEALEAGKQVICEKPMAGSLHDADRLLEAEAGSGGGLFPVFQFRFGRAFRQLDALRTAGLLGRPQVAAMETHWDRGADYYDNPWRGTWSKEMGGAVLSHAIHSHDLLCRFFDPVRQVAAMTDTRVNRIETEDCAAISFMTESGALATSSITLGAAGNSSRLRLVFAHVTAESGCNPYAPGQDDWQFIARDSGRQADVDACIAAVDEVQPQGYAGFLHAVAAAVGGAGSDEAVSSAAGRRSVELVTAIYLSSRERRFVSLPLEPECALRKGWLPPENA